MRILFLGDIVGQPGVAIIKRALPFVVAHEQIDMVIANAENVSGGSGLTPKAYGDLCRSGINMMTMGDHVFKRFEIAGILENEENICRPANFPSSAPGREFALGKSAGGQTVAAFCLLGRTFMRPVDCPFSAADRVLASLPKDIDAVVVDIHAEATADKYLIGHHLKGRVAAVLGTHTHVATADEQILPGGTAYITDVGMTGPHDSILGRRIDRVMTTTVSFVPARFDVAKGDPRLNGAIVEVEAETGQARSIRRFTLDEKRFEELHREIKDRQAKSSP